VVEGQIIRQNQLFGQDGNISQFSTRINMFCILLFFVQKCWICKLCLSTF